MMNQLRLIGSNFVFTAYSPLFDFDYNSNATLLKKSIKLLVVQTDSKDLVHMTELIASGKVKLVIDKRYSLNETAEALRYLGEGHAKGKVVITVAQNNQT